MWDILHLSGYHSTHLPDVWVSHIHWQYKRHRALAASVIHSVAFRTLLPTCTILKSIEVFSETSDLSLVRLCLCPLSLGSCVRTTRLRSSSTCQLLCWGWACSSSWTPGSPPSPATACASPPRQRCTTSCWPRSPGWAWRPWTCTSPWSRSSTSMFPRTSSSSALQDGVRQHWVLLTEERFRVCWL